MVRSYKTLDNVNALVGDAQVSWFNMQTGWIDGWMNRDVVVFFLFWAGN
jgi:hypothetical protein